MNDDRSGGVPPDSEAETIQPNKDLGWNMPEPKFQKTSGYLPQGYLDKVGVADGMGAAAAAPVVEPAAPPSADVEPQPEIAEQLEAGASVAAPPAPAVKERSTGARVALIVLGVLGMAIFIAVFLAVVYYLFIAPQGDGSTF